jgi:hypothetical protein
MEKQALKQVLFLSSEPLKQEVAGIGLRYLEFARAASEAGFQVTLSSPLGTARLEELLPDGVAFWGYEPEKLPEQLAKHDAVVVQGQLGNDVVLASPQIPVVIDLFDPWLIENAVYLPTLGFEAFSNDLQSWRLQMSRGDLFLCSSEEQRLYYAGFLTALGRIHPQLLLEDPQLENLLVLVPFGVPETLPQHQPLLPEREPGEHRLLFGALYDWYDPWTVLEAIQRLPERWTVWFVQTAHPQSTPQQKFRQLENELARSPQLQASVRILPWAPATRRFDLFRDVDLLVAPVNPGLENQLAWRTRHLEALAAGCPILLSRGGNFARTLEEAGVTRTFEPGDSEALAQAILELEEPNLRQQRIALGRSFAQSYCWPRVFEPLARFLAAPRRDPWKERITVDSTRVAVREPWRSRLRRKVQRRFGLGI